MPLLRIDQLTTGMVVESDVKDRSGRLLLRAGVELTERSLRVLQTWGVAGVKVRQTDVGEQGDDDGAQDLDPALLEETRQRLDDLFYHLDRGQPAVAALVPLIHRRIALRLRRQGAAHGH